MIDSATIRSMEISRVGFCLTCDRCGAVIAHYMPRYAWHGIGVWCEDCKPRDVSVTLCQNAEMHALDSLTNERDLYLCVGACKRWAAEVSARQSWNSEADEYNQWSELGQDERDELIRKAML